MPQELEYLDVGYRRVNQQIDLRKCDFLNNTVYCCVFVAMLFYLLDILKGKDLNTKRSIWHVTVDELNE